MRFGLTVIGFLLLGMSAGAADDLPAAPVPRAISAPRVATAPADADYGHLRYRSIGPAISGGRVSAVAGSDVNPFLYYVGSAGGGVFKTTNAGTSFTPVFAKEPVGAIGAITIAPHDDRDVWVGTGEANPRNDVSYGDGMWHSVDGGKKWTHRGLDDSSQIAKILVDPRDPKIVVVAALGNPWRDDPMRGVFRTTDGGKTWTKTLYLGPSTGASDLAWDVRHPNTIYAGMWEYRRQPWSFSSGGPAGGLYRSRDNGQSWTKLTQGLPTGLTGRIGLAVAPSDAARVYAVVQTKDGVIWRSDNGGDSWQLTDRDTLPGQRPFYFSHLRVDPRNAQRVISLSMYLTESLDGGKTFKHLTGILHPDNHDMWWSADGNRIIEGNDGGFVMSNDSGKTWSAPSNIALAQTYHVGYDLREPYTVCTGLQDNSSWCALANTRNGVGVLDRDWTSIAGGDGVWAWPDPADPNLVWTDTQDGVLTIYDSKAHQVVDVSPYPRDAFTSVAGLANNTYRFNWNSPLAFSPQDPHVAYFGGNVVFRTADRGRHWTPISPDLTRNEKDHQRASGGPISLDVSGAEYYDTLLDVAPSPLAAGVLWAGTDDGLVQLTRDGGLHWQNVTPSGWPRYGRVEVVEPGRFAPGTAFVNLDRHDLGDRAPYAYMTQDYGASWHSIRGNLPGDTPVRTLRQDLKNPAVLYAGTETGIWVSFNSGTSWQPLKLNLPTVAVLDLRIQPVANDLIVATHGNGIFILDDLAPIEALTQARSAAPYLFAIRPATLYAQWPPVETGDGGALPNNYFVGANPPAGALLSFYLRVPARVRPSIEISNASGRVVRHLAGSNDTAEGRKFVVTNTAGVNRLAWNGLEDPPVPWRGTTRQNRGPNDGPEALPGRYIARLHAGGIVREQAFELRADPASPFNLAQLQERHAFLSSLNTELSEIDESLNEIDQAMRASATMVDAGTVARRSALIAARAALTSDARNDEDSIGRPDRVRERVGGLIGALGASFQPPFAAHLASAAALKVDVDAALAQARSALAAAVVH